VTCRAVLRQGGADGGGARGRRRGVGRAVLGDAAPQGGGAAGGAGGAAGRVRRVRVRAVRGAARAARAAPGAARHQPLRRGGRRLHRRLAARQGAVRAHAPLLTSSLARRFPPVIKLYIVLRFTHLDQTGLTGPPWFKYANTINRTTCIILILSLKTIKEKR